MINPNGHIFENNKLHKKIINKDELMQLIKTNGLYGIEVTTYSDEDLKNEIFIKSNNIDDILQFAKENNIHTIFFEYFYYSPDFFKINLENLEKKYPKEVLNILKNDVNDYNKEVDNINFEIPFILNIYCLYNGYSIMIEQTRFEELYAENITQFGEQQLEIILEKNQEAINHYLDKQENQRELNLEKLKQNIFNDEEFQRSTNKDLRTAYIKDYLNKNPEYIELFDYDNGYKWNSYKWIDKIWKEYKERKQ